MIQCQQVRLGQVRHVHVIADTGAVRRRIVGAEHQQRRPASQRGIDRQRNEMRLRIVVLAQPPGRIRPGGVEVAQHAAAQSVDAPGPVERAF